VSVGNRSLLVTGGTGFVGTPFVDLARSSGWAVTTVGRSGNADVSADLLQPDALNDTFASERPTVAMFGAWTTEHGNYWTDPDNSRWLNATIAQAEAALRNGVRTIVTLGSCAEPALGWANLTPYGIAKAELARLVGELVHAQGAQHIHARIFFPFGPSEHPSRLIPSTIALALSGQDICTGPPERIRDLVHVDDLAQQLMALCDTTFDGVVDLGSGEGATIGHVVATLVELCASSSTLELGALPPRDEPNALVARENRNHPELVLPTAWPLHDRLAETVSWWRSELSHND